MLGLQCTDSAIRAVAARKSGDLLDLEIRGEQKLSRGVVREGDIVKQRALLSALRSLSSSVEASAHRISLSISPAQVHTVLLFIPHASREQQRNDTHQQLEKYLPAAVETFHVQYATVKHEEEGVWIAATAISLSVLEQYEKLCTTAGLVLDSITTTGRALGGMLQNTGAFALVNAADAEPSVLVFYGGQVVEEVLLESASSKEILKVLNHILPDYAEDEMPLLHIAVHGTQELFEEISSGFPPERKARTRKSEIEQAMTFAHVFPNLSDKDQVWGGAIASSLGRGVDMRPRIEGLNTIITQYFFAGIITIALMQFGWTIFGGSISDFWSVVTDYLARAISL